MTPFHNLPHLLRCLKPIKGDLILHPIFLRQCFQLLFHLAAARHMDMNLPHPVILHFCLQRLRQTNHILRMLQRYEPPCPDQVHRPGIFPFHLHILFLRIISGLWKIPPLKHLSRIGPHNVKIRRHICAGTEQPHIFFPVLRMILIFFLQSSRRYGFPLSFPIQPLTVTNHTFARLQSFYNITLILHTTEHYDIAFQDELSAPSRFFVIAKKPGKAFSIRIPSHFHPFLLHPLCLDEMVFFAQLFV